MAEQITSEIFQVGGSVYTSPQDAAIYLINYGGHAALVDAGCGYAHERLLRNIRECGVSLEQIEYLLITHCHFDHTGGASRLKEQLRCTVVAHELEAEYLEQGDDGVTAASWYDASIRPFTVDRRLSAAQEEISLGGRSIKAIRP
jgi:glyoxylase-like metal-dependent hydrolase (beta-lactamase superfamily II)